RALVLGTMCIAAVLTAVFILLQPNIYQSKAALLPLSQPSDSLRSALSDLKGSLPLSLGGEKNRTQPIRALLNSRTLVEDVIKHLDLLPRLFAAQWDTVQQQWRTDTPPTIQDAVRRLESLVSITSSRDGAITITTEYTDPGLAAAIANQYVDSLWHLLNHKAFSLAKMNRQFIESRLQKTREELVIAEEALQQFEQQYKIVALEAQAEAAVKAIATLEGEIMAREVRLGVLQRSMTGSSREVYLLQEEVQGLRAQLARLQYGTPMPSSAAGKSVHNGQAFPPFDEAPGVKLQYARLQRDALVQNKLFTLLAQQLEEAKIEEVRDEATFQVIDQAIPPERRIRPKRRQIALLSMIAATFLSVFLTFFREYTDTAVRTRGQIELQVGVPLLASIPVQTPRQRRQRRSYSSSAVGLGAYSAADMFTVEAFRYLYTRLKHLNGQRSVQTVLLTGIDQDEGLHTTLVGLATVTAGAGERTLLVDGNLRQPGLHSVLHCPRAPGLTDVLTTPEGWQKGVQTTAVDNLHLLPAGAVASTTVASLESPAFDALLTRLKETYNLILFAAPPVLGLTDAAVLSGKVDATCLVLTCGVTRIEAIVEAKAALEAVGANIIGAVLTGVAE
ncbi:MAG TPA: GNVR domain-containing protein, partial [Candidatus Tectomicrobia bacterium]